MIDAIQESAKLYHENQVDAMREDLVKQKDRAYILRRQIANLEDELLEKRHELTVIYNTIGNTIEALDSELGILFKDYKKK